MEDDHTELLTDLGLSNYEARAYVALVRHGAMTADDVAEASEVPLGRVYDVLNSLVDRSLVRADDGRPRTYTHVESSEAVERLLDRRIDELESKRSTFERTASAAAEELAGLTTDRSDDQFATSALHDEAARDLLLERFAATDESIRMVTNTVDVGPEWRDVFADRLLELLEEDISVHLVVSDFENTTGRVEDLLAAGLEVRRAERVPDQRFIVIDDVEVCLEVVNPVEDEELLAVVNFRDDDTARRLARSFDELWEDAELWKPGG